MKYKNTNLFCLVSLFTFIFASSSCTYDYFEDETNYVVYVPKVDINKRTDTYKLDEERILIYDNVTIESDRYSVLPFTENARSRVGNFNHKLYPGTHRVYSFSNVSQLNFSDTKSYESSHFSLKKSEDGYYEEPVGILLDTKTPLIQFPGPVVTDTAWMEHKYVGRICVAFKNLTSIDSRLTFGNIKRVEILAGDVGTVQYLSQISDSSNTRSTRMSENDIIKLTATLYQNPYKDFEYGFQNYYFPSLQNTQEGTLGESMKLAITLIGQDDKGIYTLNVDVVDRNSGYQPIILHMNQTIVVTVDGNDVQIIRLGGPEPWNPDIEEGTGNNPGGGIEI